MERTTTTISPADVERQLDFCQKVADVAARLGYPGLSAFDHAFTRATGLSPHAWRTQRKCASPQPRTP